MRYMIDGRMYTFDHRAFAALVGRNRPGVLETLKRLSGALHVSMSSLKEWRRGDHAPSDAGKVCDLAVALGVDVGTLLKSEGDETEGQVSPMTDLQKAAFARIYRKVVDFFEMFERTDQFVWKEYDVRGYPPELVSGVVLSTVYPPSAAPVTSLLYGARGVLAGDLHAQLADSVTRALERERCLLGGHPVFESLQSIIGRTVEDLCYDDEGEWLPDPDMLFDPPSFGTPSSMFVRVMEARRELDGLARRYV